MRDGDRSTMAGRARARRGVAPTGPRPADIPFSSPQPTDRIGSMESDAFSSFHHSLSLDLSVSLSVSLPIPLSTRHE
jgi:hypothetical protein